MSGRKDHGKRKLGVRHLQLLFVTFQGFVDSIALEGARKWLENKTVDYIDYSGSQQRLISDEESRYIESFLFGVSFIVRLCAPFVVYTLNNKYMSIGLSLLEIVGYVTIPHILATEMRFIGLVGVTSVVIVCQVLRYPIGMNIIAKWIPPREITRTIAVVEAGDLLGNSLSKYILMYRLFDRYIFYMLAGCKVAYIVLYFFFGAQDPQTCWILSKAEWNYLCREIGTRRKIACHFHIPWGSIARVPVLYGLMCSSIAFRWYYVDYGHFAKYLPGYEDAVNIAMMFHPFVAFFCAWGIDELINRQLITKNNVRKIWHSIAFWGCSISGCFMCYHSKEPGRVVIHFILASMFAFSYSLAGVAAAFDLSPNYALVLYSLYSFPGFLAAFLKVLFFNPSEKEFATETPFRDNLYVWYTVAFMMFALNYGFLMLGDIKWYQFDSYNAVDWRKESIISYP